MSEFQEPRYRPDLNEGLGGTIEFDDNYLFPVDLPASKVREVLEQQVEPGHQVRGSGFPYFSVHFGQGKRCDLLHSRGEDEPVDAIALYDAEEDETLGFYDVNELMSEQ